MWNRGKTLLALGMVLLWAPLPSELQELVFTDGFEKAPLDCVREGYPCSLAEADPDALARARALLQELWGIRGSGSMQDAADHLASQPDVHDIYFEGNVITFRVEGMMPVIFHDLATVVYPTVQARQVQLTKKGTQHTAALGSGSADKAQDPGIAQPMAVVGWDWNQDGIKDQKDSKSSLLLAPYQWLWGPSEIDVMADIIGTIDVYSVGQFSNPGQGDNNIILYHWTDLAPAADAFIVSTFAGQLNGSSPSVWVSSGVIPTGPTTNLPGVTLEVPWHGLQSEYQPSDRRYALLPDFWRSLDAPVRDHRLWMFIAPASIRDVKLIEDYLDAGPVKIGYWSAVTAFQPQHLTALEAVLRLMTFGVRSDRAVTMVKVDQGLLPAGGADYHFNAGNGDARLVELPSLAHGPTGAQLADPFNLDIIHFGTTGDGINDQLFVTPILDGFTADELSDVTIRYRVDNRDVPGAFNAGNLDPVEGHPFRWVLDETHALDLGFPLGPGEIPIEVILHLPAYEGGESRYTAIATQESCWANVSVTLDGESSFSGPIGFQVEADNSLSFKLYSPEWIRQDFAYPSRIATASFATEPDSAMAGEHNLVGGELGYPLLQYYGAYLEGVGSADCDVCGGKVAISAYAENSYIRGFAEVTMLRSSPPPPPGEQVLVKMTIVFRAAFGSELDGSSNFVRCKTEYDP